MLIYRNFELTIFIDSNKNNNFLSGFMTVS